MLDPLHTFQGGDKKSVQIRGPTLGIMIGAQYDIITGSRDPTAHIAEACCATEEYICSDAQI